MQDILANHVEREETRILCVRYTDERSIAGNSLEDMKLGRKHKMVGCSNKLMGLARPQDIVIITAGPDKKRQFHIGILRRKVDVYTLWSDHGGEMWQHNWEYDPITPDLDVQQYSNTLREIAEGAIKAHNLFNTRLCGYGKPYAPYIARMLREGILPVA